MPQRLGLILGTWLHARFLGLTLFLGVGPDLQVRALLSSNGGLPRQGQQTLRISCAPPLANLRRVSAGSS